MGLSVELVCFSKIIEIKKERIKTFGVLKIYYTGIVDSVKSSFKCTCKKKIIK
jgi:hypothetical protein